MVRQAVEGLRCTPWTDGRTTEARNFKGNLRRDDSGAEVAAVPFPASAALVACPIHDLDTSGDCGGGAVVRQGRRRKRNSELRNAEVCKDRRTAEWTAGLRSINRRKTQDAAAESGTTEAARRRSPAKNAGDASGGERSPEEGSMESPYSSLLPYLSVGDYWPPNKGSSSRKGCVRVSAS